MISYLSLPFITGVNKCEFRPRHRIFAPGCRLSTSGAGCCASGVKTEWKPPQAQKISPEAWNRKSSSTFFLCKYLQTSALFLHELGYNTSKNTWNWSSFNVMTNVITTPNLFHSLSSRNISISGKTKHYLNPFGYTNSNPIKLDTICTIFQWSISSWFKMHTVTNLGKTKSIKQRLTTLNLFTPSPTLLFTGNIHSINTS